MRAPVAMACNRIISGLDGGGGPAVLLRFAPAEGRTLTSEFSAVCERKTLYASVDR